MLVSGQNKAMDLSSLLMIHSVATAFKSLLRPSELISHDKGPAESLTMVITDVFTDKDVDTIDKVQYKKTCISLAYNFINLIFVIKIRKNFLIDLMYIKINV